MNRRERKEQQRLREILGQPGAPKAYDDYQDDTDNYPYGYTPTPAKKRRGGLVALVLLLVLASLGVATLIVIKLTEYDGWGEINSLNEAQAAAVAPLTETADAGQAYLDETMFFGDSNTVRLEHYGLVPQSRVKALSGIGVEGALVVSFSADGESGSATMAQAIAAQKPKRALITLGTNDIGVLSAEDFAGRYGQLLDELHKASPGTLLVVNSIPPVADSSGYGRLSTQKVKEYNAALLALCREKGVAYLDSYATLAQDGQQVKAGYTDGDGVHLSQQALQAMLDYYTTHAYNSQEPGI